MDTFQWILLFSVYIFAGANIGQLTNLIDRERNEYTTDNRWMLAGLWLPISFLAMLEYWQFKQQAKREDEMLDAVMDPKHRKIWEEVKADWIEREFEEPLSSFNNNLLELPLGFDGNAANWFAKAEALRHTDIPKNLNGLLKPVTESETVFTQPLTLVKPTASDTVEPAGD